MTVDCSAVQPKQVLVMRSSGSSPTDTAREVDNIESDNKAFKDAVTIGKRLERDAEMFISGTVKTLRDGDAILTSEQESDSHLHMQAIRIIDDHLAAPLIQYHPKTRYPSLCREAHFTEASNGVPLGVKVVPATYRPSAVGLLDTYTADVFECSSGEDALNSVVLADNLIRNDDVAHLLVFNSEQHCTELALQLTLFMSAQFRSIDPEKLWHHLYRQCRGCHIEKTIETLRRHALTLRAWTATSIVEQNDPEARAGVMTFLIALAFRCRKLRNFDALCAIYSGLTFGFTEKLSHESLPLTDATKRALQDLSQLIQKARSDFESPFDRHEPAVPPVEWFVEDLTSICGERHHVGIPVVDSEMYGKAARTVRSMERCQIPYQSVARAGVQAWMSKAFLNVAPRDLDVRSLVKSRCDDIERRGRRGSPVPMRTPQSEFVWRRAEITDLVLESLTRGLESSS